jgi:hypothetical protein
LELVKTIITKNMKFENPWKDLAREDCQRTTVDISREALAKIHRVYNREGVVQKTFYLLITKLINELERAGYTEYDVGYEVAVADCTITLGGQRSAAAGPAAGSVDNGPQQATGRDDGSGTPRLARTDARPSNSHDPNVASSVSGNPSHRTAKGKKRSKAVKPE